MHLKFSQDLHALLERMADHPLTLGDVLEETSERGFGLVIGLLVLPFLFPMPPGFTTVLGTGCLLLSVQMVVGSRSPWLPRQISRFRFPQAFTRQLLKNAERFTQWVERIARPRWGAIAQNSHIWQLNGCVLTWLTILLMLPIPFTNPIPTLGILLIVVAMLEADGLLLVIGYGFTILISLIIAGIAYLLWRSPEFIQNLM
jgi:hypothetical protein